MATSIFGSDDKKNESNSSEVVYDNSKNILKVISRLKDTENSFILVNEKIEMLDHNAVENFKKINNDIKSLRLELRDMKNEIEEIKMFNSKVNKQMKGMATSDEVIRLEKYIDLWNPMNFVTSEQIDESNKKIIKELKTLIINFLEDYENKSDHHKTDNK